MYVRGKTYFAVYCLFLYFSYYIPFSRTFCSYLDYFKEDILSLGNFVFKVYKIQGQIQRC